MRESIALKDVTLRPSNVESFSVENVHVGKDILELLSSSMYVNPLTMYREYIQNATDSIDEAVAAKLLPGASQGKIMVTLSVSERKITIHDNGVGISNQRFQKLMSSFGSSKKKGTGARGFRGVGRFAGLGYCQNLTFRTKAEGEKLVSEMHWDGRLLKKALKENTELSLEQLVKQVASFSKVENELREGRFFEVVLENVVRIKNDILLNEQEVYEYLSHHAPVGFDPEFRFKKDIEAQLDNYGINYKYQVSVASDFSGGVDVYRPYKNEFKLTELSLDRIEGFELVELSGVEGGVSALSLTFKQNYKGLIPSSENIKGIRVRVGNIQIGDEKLLTDVFPESRFNSWSIGEIHILDRKVLPNGRRDNFESNVHWEEIQNQLAPIFQKIARTCRVNSSVRNALKQFESLDLKCKEILSILRQNTVPKDVIGEYRDRATKIIEELYKLADNRSLSGHQNETLRTTALKRAKELEKLSGDTNASKRSLIDQLPKNKQNLYRELAHNLYELSPNKKFADDLIERLARRALKGS